MCANDYFMFEINGVLRACDDESIVCSKLSDIVMRTKANGNGKVIELFGYKERANDPFDKIRCFDGTVTGGKKIPETVVEYYYKKKEKKKKEEEEE